MKTPAAQTSIPAIWTSRQCLVEQEPGHERRNSRHQEDEADTLRHSPCRMSAMKRQDRADRHHDDRPAERDPGIGRRIEAEPLDQAGAERKMTIVPPAYCQAVPVRRSTCVTWRF